MAWGLGREGSPYHSRPPSVSPSEGASTSEGPVGIQSTTTPLKYLGGNITQSTYPVTSQLSSLLSVITGRNNGFSTAWNESVGFSKSEDQNENQNVSKMNTAR